MGTLEENIVSTDAIAGGKRKSYRLSQFEANSVTRSCHAQTNFSNFDLTLIQPQDIKKMGNTRIGAP